MKALTKALAALLLAPSLAAAQPAATAQPARPLPTGRATAAQTPADKAADDAAVAKLRKAQEAKMATNEARMKRAMQSICRGC